MIYETNSAKETHELGKRIGSNAKKGQIYTLKAIWEWERPYLHREWQMDWESKNRSAVRPSQLSKNIRKAGSLYHFDVYRIGDVEEMEEIGYDDYFSGMEFA